jgi:methylenetetrahydrofolate dehydrogenase (NADP+) / methenyltetrahydrofolate cyclohydrolase
MIINGRKIRDEILKNVKDEVAVLPFMPVFCDVLIGDDPVSAQYIEMKAKTAESIGIHYHHADFPREITTEELVHHIKKLNTIDHMCGLIVQMPLPEHLNQQAVLNAIDSRIDVDCLGMVASEIFYKGDATIGFPTALACMAVLDSVVSDLHGKNIVVIGQGMLVGKPVTYLLQKRGLSVYTIEHSIEGKEAVIADADVIISATGAGKILTGDMIKAGAIVIDAGTSESNGGVVGDIDRVSVEPRALYLSPTPGGVGPVTVAMLLRNVALVAQKKSHE